MGRKPLLGPAARPDSLPFSPRLELITTQATRAGFTGGVVVDYPQQRQSQEVSAEGRVCPCSRGKGGGVGLHRPVACGARQCWVGPLGPGVCICSWRGRVRVSLVPQGFLSPALTFRFLISGSTCVCFLTFSLYQR